MTFDEYDAITEKFEKIKARGKVPTFWPTVQQVDMFRENPEMWLLFSCYLHDFNPPPKTAAEKYSKKNLSAFINDNLELSDGGA